MDKRTGLTKTEMVVIITASIFILLLILSRYMRVTSDHRTGYCLGNLKDLTLAWIMYADDNDGKIVNGAAGISRPNEPAWVGRDWADDYREGGALAPKEQEEAIGSGALWPYNKNVRTYSCPMIMRERKRTYSIVDSMNGVPQPGNPMGRGPKDVLDMLIAKDRGQIQSPDIRAVFICVGWAAPGSYAVYYDKEKWWDLPSVQHDNNWTIVSFADSHTEFWKWKSKKTIELFKTAGPTQLSQHVSPTTRKGKEDLQMVQKAVWGKLGYTPSVSE